PCLCEVWGLLRLSLYGFSSEKTYGSRAWTARGSFSFRASQPPAAGFIPGREDSLSRCVVQCPDRDAPRHAPSPGPLSTSLAVLAGRHAELREGVEVLSGRLCLVDAGQPTRESGRIVAEL